MEKTTKSTESLDGLVLENVSKWQISKEPLAALSEDQLDVVYQVDDVVKSVVEDQETVEANVKTDQVVDTFEEFVKFYVELESDLRVEDLEEYNVYYNQLKGQAIQCQNLFSEAEKTTDALNLLRNIYFEVTTKTNSLHSLSEMLMIDQKHLKDKKEQLNESLHHFVAFNHLYDSIERTSKRINDKEFTDFLDEIDNAIDYLNKHINYKESRIYRMKYESLLSTALNHVYTYVNNIVTEAIKHVTEPENTAALLNIENTDPTVESAFSLYYGKFQNAACKVKTILSHIENKTHKHIHYENMVYDCQKTYFAQRSPIISAAVSKALSDLKEQHRNDYSVLFRSACLFVMKVCQDESMCYFYFFDGFSQQLSDYLGGLCQYLYDSLRPSLISINHLEVLTELCSILRREMLNDQVHSNDSLARFADTVRQMLEDVEERLVFRTNVFFQHDLAGYRPSRGDLMYPEKLQHMEGISLDGENRSESRNSVASLDSHEVATINAAPLPSFRSYTGNSPADLHGMWYPTVKRTLVCLSRLYFCLDRQTFQALAQEALAVCVQTIESAAAQIATLKTPIDAKLFQIKHLLIVREQIAPFQVDFTVTEMALDFSNVKSAAMGLINNRNKLFAFSSNNALLEFLLEGTPRVKEYLVDSRKEIDKHLKTACESFINYVTMLLVGNVVRWLQKAEKLLKGEQTPVFDEHEFLKPQTLAAILNAATRNIKTKVPEVQSSMQLYLANRETEFILFRPIKNNLVNTFMQMEEALSSGKYTADDLLIIGCPSAEQINVLLCSVSLVTEQDSIARSRKTSRASRTTEET